MQPSHCFLIVFPLSFFADLGIYFEQYSEATGTRHSIFVGFLAQLLFYFPVTFLFQPSCNHNLLIFFPTLGHHGFIIFLTSSWPQSSDGNFILTTFFFINWKLVSLKNNWPSFSAAVTSLQCCRSHQLHFSLFSRLCFELMKQFCLDVKKTFFVLRGSDLLETWLSSHFCTIRIGKIIFTGFLHMSLCWITFFYKSYIQVLNMSKLSTYKVKILLLL